MKTHKYFLNRASVFFLFASFFSLGSTTTADTIRFSNGDFELTTVFSDVQFFEFEIQLAGQLCPGTAYVNPELIVVDYAVQGELKDGTPSGFPAFFLMRTIPGDEFYAQGSSMMFEISADADLTDGLQIDELAGEDPVFVFNGREIGTGRFHPALVELNSDGTGRIQNSNNVPDGKNEIDFGAEYITDLTFDPSTLTLTLPQQVTTANSIDAIRGIQVDGLASDTAQSDDMYLKYQPGPTLKPSEPPVWLQIDGVLPLSDPATLSVTLEAGANTPGLSQTIEMFNWTTGDYEQVDARAASFNQDQKVKVEVDVDKYVQSGTGAVRTRLGWRPNSPVFLFPWTVCIDQFVWTTTVD